MNRVLFIIAVVLILCIACTPNSTNETGATTSPGVVTATRADPDPTPASPADGFVSSAEVKNLMQAKLTHAHILLDAIAIQDYPRVALSANELAWISQLGEWKVSDSAEYIRCSDEFRSIMEDMVECAEGGDRFGVLRAHETMVTSCAQCHEYLRRAGHVPSVPGTVSWGGLETEDANGP